MLYHVKLRKTYYLKFSMREAGIEPAELIWKTSSLPLTHSRLWGQEDSNLRRKYPMSSKPIPLGRSGIPSLLGRGDSNPCSNTAQILKTCSFGRSDTPYGPIGSRTQIASLQTENNTIII